MFVGRKDELKILSDIINSKQIEVGVIYGQRRIGKTSLIKEAIKNCDSIYFLARDTSYQDNLDDFNKVVNKYMNLPSFNSFTSFDDAFRNLLMTKKEDTIIVIDELPFLAKSYPGVISFLQGVIDEYKSNNSILKLILSGSDFSFMTDLLKDRAKPLYQRATFKIHVKPMIFTDALKMLGGIEDYEEKAKYLSIFGNRPYYLEKIKVNKSYEDNIKDLFFDNSSVLIDAPNMTLPIGFSSNSAYVSILLAISNRKHKIQEIASAIHYDDKVVSTYLRRMLDAEVIEKRDIFNGNKKTVFYEISDPFIRLYYGVIFPLLPDIESGYKNESYLVSENKIKKVIEHGFEDVVNSYIHELNISHSLPHIYRDIKKYETSNSILGRPVQIDGVSESFDSKHLLVIEAKFRDKDISKEVLDHLVESASIFTGYKSIDYYLISKKGFSDNIRLDKKDNVFLITLKEMMD